MRKISRKDCLRILLFTISLLLGTIIFIAEAYSGKAGFSSIIAGMIVSFSVVHLLRIESKRLRVVCILISGMMGILGPAFGLSLSILLPMTLFLLTSIIKTKQEARSVRKSYSRGILVITPSIGSICNFTAQISLYLVISGKKLVIVDWDGSVSEILRERGVPFRQAGWRDISLSYPGRLGPNYVAVASVISSLITGIGAEIIASAIKERASVELPETVRLIRDIIAHEGVLLDDAIPGLGPLIINVSDLDLMSRDLVSALVMLQSLSFGYRDFILVIPIISPISENSLRAAGGRVDIVEWVIREAVKRGCVIVTGPEPSIVALREFDSLIVTRGVYSVMGRDLNKFLPNYAKKLVKNEADVLISGGSAEPFQIGVSSLDMF
ncbi:MAG: hypothetical protein ACP5KE_03535 [Candidatus Methanodesulfokora sp.]|nr:MAG: hypothetical protein C0200_07885 [Candidatus Korarchaeota archaeon]